MLEKTIYKWHVLKVKSMHERKVYNLLESLNFKTYNPFLKLKRKWCDRIKKIIINIGDNILVHNLVNELIVIKIGINSIWTELKNSNIKIKLISC